jgi:hypothetical protein
MIYRGLPIPEWIQVQWDTGIGKAWRTGVDMAINTTIQEFDTQIGDWINRYERHNANREETTPKRLRRKKRG